MLPWRPAGSGELSPAIVLTGQRFRDAARRYFGGCTTSHALFQPDQTEEYLGLTIGP
jgi:hypothetical protein